APAPIDPEVRLVRVPLRTALPVPLGPQPVSEQRGEAGLPLAHRLVREDEAALEEHLGQVAQAQLVAQPPEDHQQDEVGRVLQVVVRRAGPLVADPATCRAAEGAVAQGGAPPLFDGRGGAVWARHEHLLRATINAATLPEADYPGQPLSDF